MSIYKSPDKTRIILSRKCHDKPDTITELEALFDENGQMIIGSFPSEHLHFERNGATFRRIIRDGRRYLSMGIRDKEWDLSGQRVAPIKTEDIVSNRALLKEDNLEGGLLEIFLEFVRLKTSIM